MAHQHEDHQYAKEYLGGDNGTPGILGITGRNKPQQITDNYTFAKQAQEAIDVAIKGVVKRPLGAK